VFQIFQYPGEAEEGDGDVKYQGLHGKGQLACGKGSSARSRFARYAQSPVRSGTSREQQLPHGEPFVFCHQQESRSLHAEVSEADQGHASSRAPRVRLILMEQMPGPPLEEAL